LPSLRELLRSDVVKAAAGLVGCVLERRWSDRTKDAPAGGTLRAVIIETEAYHQTEPGCHAHKRRTPKNEAMFGSAGTLYVYFTYGNWFMLNVVCEAKGTAAAVLIRGLAPLGPGDGWPDDGAALRLHGPGLLCRELQIDKRHNSLDALARGAEIRLLRPARLYGAPWSPPPLAATTRVGFSWEDKLPWRFVWAGHPALGNPSLKPLRRKG
jgi:DNA-3-methyladenine glycosylase